MRLELGFVRLDPDQSQLLFTPSGTKTRSCRPHVLVDEPTEEISPFDVGHPVGLFDGSETLGYLKLQSPMRASPVVVLHIDPQDAIEMPGAEDQQPPSPTKSVRLGCKGTVNEGIGKLTGDKKLETKGKVQKVQGKVQDGLGDVQDAVRKDSHA